MKLLPFATACVCMSLTSFLFGDSEAALDTILKVGKEGSGNVEASIAWKELSRGKMDDIPTILSKMSNANPLAGNYLRSAIDSIVQRETAAGETLPVAALGSLLLDVGQNPKARHLAFQLIEEALPTTAKRLTPGLLNDPSTPLRRNAVQQLIDNADAMKKEDDSDGATLLYQQALGAARDLDQIKTLSKALGELGQEIDLPRHFGFLMHWKVVAPFDNTERAGHAAVYPPEKEIDLSAEYAGKSGDVSWQNLVTSDPYGKVDFNKPYGTLKGAVGYAFTEFNSATARPAELRLGCKNGWKVWLNGELLFERDEYHRGQRIDQYLMPVQLKAGRNTILVKCSQDEQTQDWTVQWEFQLRVCDASGTAILAPDRPPTPKPEKATRRPSKS